MNSKNLVQAKTVEKEKWKFHEIHIDYGSDLEYFCKNQTERTKRKS